MPSQRAVYIHTHSLAQTVKNLLKHMPVQANTHTHKKQKTEIIHAHKSTHVNKLLHYNLLCLGDHRSIGPRLKEVM